MNLYNDNRFYSLANISLLNNKLHSVMQKGMNEITPKQWLLLVVLRTFDNPPLLTELAQACDITHQSTRQLLSGLEQKNLVQIIPDSNDKRSLRVHQTNKGEHWREINFERNKQFVFDFFSVLSQEEITTFCSMQTRLLKKLEDIEENFIKNENK